MRTSPRADEPTTPPDGGADVRPPYLWALGAGFVVSALMAYVISTRMGLVSSSPRPDHA